LMCFSWWQDVVFFFGMSGAFRMQHIKRWTACRNSCCFHDNRFTKSVNYSSINMYRYLFLIFDLIPNHCTNVSGLTPPPPTHPTNQQQE
jgi:hypothetical protein